MPATSFDAIISPDSVKKEMEELFGLVGEMATESGYHGLPADFEKRVEPRLRLIKEKLSQNSKGPQEARGQRIEELKASLADTHCGIDKFLSEMRDAGSTARKESGARGWQTAVTVSGLTLLGALCLEEFRGTAIHPRLALIVGLFAAMVVINLRSLIGLPRQILTAWSRWKAFHRTLERSAELEAELEKQRTEELREKWVGEWTDQWAATMRDALQGEFAYAHARAKAARHSVCNESEG